MTGVQTCALPIFGRDATVTTGGDRLEADRVILACPARPAAELLGGLGINFRLLLGEGNQRGNWRDLLNQSAVKKGVEILQEKLDFTADVIKLALGRSQTLDSIFERINYPALR